MTTTLPGVLATTTTPAALIDWPTVERNIVAMAARAKAAGTTLRPHAKTHKSVEIARLQLAAGAEGLTVATPHEAERFARAGFKRLTLARPVADRGSLASVVAVAARAELLVVADDEQTVRAFDAAADAAGVGLGLLWEVDSGLGRCGTAPGGETAKRIAALVDDLRATRIEGVMTFGGHVYAATSSEEVARIAREEAAAVATTADALEERGIPAQVRSVGTTPTAHYVDLAKGATEIRPGNYVFNDSTQIGIGVARLEDCAASVLTTVVSRPAPDRAIVDAGSKALSNERLNPAIEGLGIIPGLPRLTVDRLYEEHGILIGPDAARLEIGDRIRIVPTHACTTMNLHTHALRVDGDEVLGDLTIDARGWG